MTHLHRRQFLKSCCVAAVAGGVGSRARAYFAPPPIIPTTATDDTLVIVFLRGAMDGLSLLPPGAQSLALQLGLRIIGIDRPGFGQSDPRPDYSFDGVAEGLIRLLLLTGHRLSAAEALRAGIVDEVVPLSQLADCARALADELAAKPRAALIRTKAAILAASPPGAWLAGPGSQPEPATEQQQKEPAQSHEGVRV